MRRSHPSLSECKQDIDHRFLRSSGRQTTISSLWSPCLDALITLASHLRATVIQYAFNEAITTGKQATLCFNRQVFVCSLSDGQSVGGSVVFICSLDQQDSL